MSTWHPQCGGAGVGPLGPGDGASELDVGGLGVLWAWEAGLGVGSTKAA